MIEVFGKNDQEDRLAPKRGAQPRGRTCKPARLNAMPTACRVIPYLVAICCRVFPATYSRYAVATQAVIRGAEGAGSCCSTSRPLLFWDRAEDIGPKLMSRNKKGLLDEQHELGRHWATASNPLTDEWGGGTNGLSQSCLAASFEYSFTDRVHVHASRVALLFPIRNSIATSFGAVPLIALRHG